MRTETYKEERPLLTAIKCQPCVSVIMPFDPKMASESGIKHSLKIATDHVKHELFKHYNSQVAEGVFNKLEDAINNLDYRTHKKSIAIYVSPVIKKVYYLSIPVTEKITVDSSFQIRNLLLNKKEKHEFLLVVLSAKKEKIYVGNTEKLTQIVSNSAAHVQRDLPEPVANFSDPRRVREIRLQNFLRYIDKGLSFILKAYPLPVFVMATEKNIGYFKQITKHQQYVTGYIHGNFEDASIYELQTALEPHLQNWDSVKQRDVFNKLNIAQNNFKLATGITNVWEHANRKHSQLLVVEKDFNCPSFTNEDGETVFENGENHKGKIETRDAVNDIIEKVLESGGDVEFVSELKDFNHIALIEYYQEN